MKNLNFTNISQAEDARVLATSYMLYKIGKCRLVTFFVIYKQVIDIIFIQKRNVIIM